MNIHVDPRASVSPKARLGANVTIGPYTVVEDDVVIGDGTAIAANALIANGTRLGKECRIHHGAVIGNAPQDLKYAGEPTTCELGDRNIVREYAVFHRGTGEGGRTVVGNDNFFMAYTHLAHDCVIGNNVIMANAAMLAGHVTIEDYVIIGGLTPVHQFVHVGRHSMVGGAVRVSKDVPPFILAGNEPLVFEGLNHIGLRRRGFAKESMEALHRAYTVLYRSHLNVSQALARIQDDAVLMGCNEVRILVEFVASSKRGIIPAPRLAS